MDKNYRFGTVKMGLSFVQNKGGEMIDVKHLVKNHAAQSIPLNFEEAYELGIYMIEGCRGNGLAQIQTIAILSALHNKHTYAWGRDESGEKAHGNSLPKNSAEQIAGICAAIFQEDIGKSQFGFLRPNVPYVMDTSGMGGDLVVTANVSTLASFVAAAAGIPICKHGSPANADAGRHGSSDFVELCGINQFSSKEEVERSIETLLFGFTEALDTRYKLIHLQTHEVAKLPHMNDIIGPVTNPVDPSIMTRRVLGVNHLISPTIVAQAYKILNEKGITNLQHGLFVRGFCDDNEEGGMDELSICQGGTQIAELKNGTIKDYWLHAQDFGLEPVAKELISPPSMSKGIFSLAILTSAPAKMIAANAALLLWLAEKSDDLKICYKQAEEILLSGQAHQKMLAVRQMLPIKKTKNEGR